MMEAEYTPVKKKKKKKVHAWYAEGIYVRDKIFSSEDVDTSVEPPEWISSVWMRCALDT